MRSRTEILRKLTLIGSAHGLNISTWYAVAHMKTLFVFASVALAIPCCARAVEPIDRVIARATELTGPSFQSCGSISINSPGAEDCFLAAYEGKLPAIATSSVSGTELRTAKAQVLAKDGAFVTVSASNDKAELTEHRCGEPFVAIEFTRKRLRCRDDYVEPLGASILREPPVWLTSNDEQPKLLGGGDVPKSVCSKPFDGKIIVQLLVDSAGRVPDLQIIRLPDGCSAQGIRNVLKSWRFSRPMRNGKAISTVKMFTISF